MERITKPLSGRQEAWPVRGEGHTWKGQAPGMPGTAPAQDTQDRNQNNTNHRESVTRGDRHPPVTPMYAAHAAMHLCRLPTERTIRRPVRAHCPRRVCAAATNERERLERRMSRMSCLSFDYRWNFLDIDRL